MRVRGLYAIADTATIAPGALTVCVHQALGGGAALVQYRDKGASAEHRRRDANTLLTVCREHGAGMIVNDDVTLAAEVGADGVHIGAEDLNVEIARKTLGPQALIGVSCYDSLERALEMQMRGADYVAFGSFFASPTKPRAVRAGIDLLRRATETLDVPIVAIGGVTAENAPALVEAGADMIAVIGGLFAQPDVEAAARRLARLFT
ncbi:MAG: thiamine phosphate synthase [Gammaproteobacteria bacterium]|nr:thiamine phosphate synthase [Gammaproteobacteria bacterium]